MESIILFLPSLILRLVSANQSFWLDEGASISFARLPLSSFFTSIGNDFHPPLFYLLTHFWILISGKTEWLIRLPNVIFGSLCIPIFFKLLKEILPKEKRRFALLGALLLMINPLHVYYSAELRMYSLNTLLSLLSWLYLLRAVKENSSSAWRFYCLFSVLNLYTFYGSIINLFSQFVYTLWQHRDKVKQLLVWNLVIFVFFLPWVPTLLHQLSGGGYLTKVLPGWSELSGNLSLKSIGLIMAKFSFGRITIANKSAYTIFVAGISIYFVLCSYLASLSKEGKVFLAWFFGSLAFAILISLRTPILGYWRFVFLLPPFISIVAIGLSNLPENAINLNLFVVFLVFVLGNIIFLITPSLHREDWRQAAQIISQDKSISIVNFPDVFAPLKFYAPNIYYFPDQVSLGKMRPDLDQTLPLVLKGKETIFVFDYLSDLTDRKRTVNLWLKEAGYKQYKTHNVNGVGFIYEFGFPK